MIVDLHELHFGELFEIRHERLSNCVKRSIRLTIARQIKMRNAIGIYKAFIASKTVQNESKSPVALYIAGSLEEFVQDCADQVFG